MKKERVTATTTQDVKENSIHHPCPNCAGDSPQHMTWKSTWHGGVQETQKKDLEKAHWLTRRSRRWSTPRQSRAWDRVFLHGIPVENVAYYEYLDSTFNAGGGSEEDIEKRMNLAKAKSARLHRIWDDARLSRDLRIRLYTVRVVSTSLYGCQSWHLNTAATSKGSTQDAWLGSTSVNQLRCYNSH